MDSSLKSWLAENLMLGGNPEELKNILISLGVPDGEAHDEVVLAMGHPYIDGGKKIKGKLDRRESLLRTLDYQLRQKGAFDKLEKQELPPFQKFLEDFYYENKPAIFKNAVPNWKAMEWTPRKLMEKVGAETVIQIQLDRDKDANYEQNSHFHRQDIKFGKFIDMLESVESSNNFYMTANNMVLGRPEFKCVVDDTGNIGDGWLNPERIGKETHLWIGPKGTITPLHHDLTNNLFLQVYGEKLFHLIPSVQVPYMHNEHHVFSVVDLLNPDYTRVPNYKNITPIEIEVGPGDLLFIPIGWWHHVVSLSPNISLSFTNVNLPFNGFIDFPASNNARY